MYYFQFHIGDYTSSTAHLTELEDLAYRRMLDWCYVHEKSLPEAVEDIARLIRMRSHCDCIASVLREFFDRNEDGWANRRVVREIEAFKGKSEKARQSAKARWDANALRSDSEGNANHKPRTINQEPVTKSQEPEEDAPKVRRLTCPEDVSQEVWSAYMAVRKAKRAPITDLALRANRREAAAAGLTLEQALTFCCEANWQAFNAQWWRDRTAKTSVGKQSALEARNAEVARRFLASQEDV